MAIDRKIELKKQLLKMAMFSGGALLTFSAGRCAAKKASKENLDSVETYYAAPIVVINDKGETTYTAPTGFELTFDENGKPYCYKTVITSDIKTLKKSK